MKEKQEAFTFEQEMNLERWQRNLSEKAEEESDINPASPVKVTGNSIVSGWWGKAWSTNLNQYGEYTRNWIQGRRHVVFGTIVDLKIRKGLISVKARGNREKPYNVKIHVEPLSVRKYIALLEKCQDKPKTVEDLFAGRFSEKMKEILQDEDGLFPSVDEIQFSCDCPDRLHMCRHIIAALYGVGHRLDENPDLLFSLRGIEAENFVDKNLEKKIEQMLENGKQVMQAAIEEQEMRKLSAFWEDAL